MHQIVRLAPCPRRKSRWTCCAKNTPRATSARSPRCRGGSRAPSPPLSRRHSAPTANGASCGPSSRVSFPPAGLPPPPASACAPPSSTVSCNRSATRSQAAATACPASIPRSARRPKPCAAAAGSATTSARFAHSAARWPAPPRAPRGRCLIWKCSTPHAARSNRPAPGAAPRWVCCTSAIRTSSASSRPRTRAGSPTSISRSA